ncbi:Sin3 histone deacetylase corepressor complex component SDS3 [Lamellibrachia satsuma]|nr:Sin3 histone deacetylase corepressor complex component SDS3 [Lamellibrachia satsuma]
MASYSYSPMLEKDTELDDSFDFIDDRRPASDEDTEDASETDMAKREEEFTEIKEQMYQDKLAQLKKQLQQLKDSTLPDYMKKLKKIEQHYKERVWVSEVWYNYVVELIEKDYIKEKRRSIETFEEKKIELNENLIMELEDKKKQIENERHTIELTGDSMEVKPATTRKLRRRPNDPMPIPEKRRKTSPTQLNYFLQEEEILEDLRIINKVSGKPVNRKTVVQSVPPASCSDNVYEARIDDGRLYFDKRWFHRGQGVFVESKELGKVAAVISAIGTMEVWLRKTSDNSKLRIYITQLQKGKYTLKRRAA